jgi:murein DD-endopeptidase MepM/ murein hydrolase activator NlpD
MKVFPVHLPVALLLLCLLSCGCAAQSSSLPPRQEAASAGSGQPARVLALPEEIWAGEPFLARVQSPGLDRAVLVWRGKTLSARPGAGNQPEKAVLFLLAVPQKEEASSLPLVLTLTRTDGQSETLRASLPVRRRAYPEQRLKVANKYVRLTPAQQARVKRDQLEVRETLAKVSPVRHWSLPMLRPVPGKITSVYGLRRFFNGEERSPHRGIEFAAERGDPVPACADGLAVLASEHYFGGKTVILDHGLGVFSLYLHLSGFALSPGEFVRRGQTIGFVGDTGRVTGPHLHFSLAVQGDLVDAAPCLEGMGDLADTETGSRTEPAGRGAPQKKDRPVAGKGEDL